MPASPGLRRCRGINGRVSGYRRAYKEAGLPFNSNLLVEGDFSMESGMAAVKKLLGQTFTAVFACNDMMAIGALKELQANRIRVRRMFLWWATMMCPSARCWKCL